MAVRTRARSAGQESIAGATSAAEASRIRRVIHQHKFPCGVSGWSAEYGDDSTGDPAVWIWFYVKDENEISDRRIDELADFMGLIQSDLLATNISRLPYAGYRNPPA